MPNPNGSPASLVHAEPGNLRAARHGFYSDRLLVDEIKAEWDA